MNNNLLGKYSTFIVPVLLLVVLIALVVFVLKPSIDKLRKDSDRVQERLVELDTEKDKINDLPKIKEQFLKIEKHKDDCNVLFSRNNIIALVQEIEQIAEATGSSIEISVDDEDDAIVKKTKANIKKVDKEAEKLLGNFSEEEYFLVDIHMEGSYSGFMNFINRLNNLKYYNSLVSFNIIPQEKDDKGVSSAREDSLNSNASDEELEENKDNDATILKSEITVVFYLDKVK